MKKITADWIIIKQGQVSIVFSLHNGKKPSHYFSSEHIIKNGEINIFGGILCITGDEINYGYSYEHSFAPFDELIKTIEETDIQSDYKTFWDRLKKKKSYYVKGYYRLKKTIPFKWSTTTWTIKDNK